MHDKTKERKKAFSVQERGEKKDDLRVTLARALWDWAVGGCIKQKNKGIKEDNGTKKSWEIKNSIVLDR